jgi:hypothetical protein
LRVELKTSRLLNGCSNQLSYESSRIKSPNRQKSYRLSSRVSTIKIGDTMVYRSGVASNSFGLHHVPHPLPYPPLPLLVFSTTHPRSCRLRCHGISRLLVEVEPLSLVLYRVERPIRITFRIGRVKGAQVRKTERWRESGVKWKWEEGRVRREIAEVGTGTIHADAMPNQVSHENQPSLTSSDFSATKNRSRFSLKSSMQMQLCTTTAMDIGSRPLISVNRVVR